MAKPFISGRRVDIEQIVGRIHGGLIERFASKEVLLDSNSIRLRLVSDVSLIASTPHDQKKSGSCVFLGILDTAHCWTRRGS